MNDIDMAQLARWLAATDIAELELRSPTGQARLLRGAEAKAEAAPGPERFAGSRSPGVAGNADTAATRTTTITTATTVATASSVGVFLERHPLRAAPFVKTGDVVSEGQTVALLRIGALLLAVQAPCAGSVGAWHVAPGTPVGYGTALLDIASPPSIE